MSICILLEGQETEIVLLFLLEKNRYIPLSNQKRQQP